MSAGDYNRSFHHMLLSGVGAAENTAAVITTSQVLNPADATKRRLWSGRRNLLHTAMCTFKERADAKDTFV